MKNVLAGLGLFLALFSFAAFSQTYPVTAPVYIPTAVLAPVTTSITGNVVFQSGNLAVVTVRISALTGTLAATVQGTNDNTNWTTLQAAPIGGGPAITSLTTTGFWMVNSAGFTKVRVNIGALSSGPVTIAMAGTAAPNLVTLLPSTSGDPCQLSGIQKQAAVINVGAAATTKIVDVSGSKNIYVCGVVASLAGTTPTVKFVNGTHTSADCDTSSTALSGTFAPSTGSMVVQSESGTIFTSGASNQLCATTTGTGSSFQGILTYVQQ